MVEPGKIVVTPVELLDGVQEFVGHGESLPVVGLPVPPSLQSGRGPGVIEARPLRRMAGPGEGITL